MNMKPLGKVAVDSGRLVIGDPCHIVDHPELCVEFPTGSGDGYFDVVELTIDGVKYVAVDLDSSTGAKARALWQRHVDKANDQSEDWSE